MRQRYLQHLDIEQNLDSRCCRVVTQASGRNIDIFSISDSVLIVAVAMGVTAVSGRYHCRILILGRISITAAAGGIP